MPLFSDSGHVPVGGISSKNQKKKKGRGSLGSTPTKPVACCCCYFFATRRVKITVAAKRQASASVPPTPKLPFAGPTVPSSPPLPPLRFSQPPPRLSGFVFDPALIKIHPCVATVATHVAAPLSILRRADVARVGPSPPPAPVPLSVSMSCPGSLLVCTRSSRRYAKPSYDE